MVKVVCKCLKVVRKCMKVVCKCMKVVLKCMKVVCKCMKVVRKRMKVVCKCMEVVRKRMKVVCKHGQHWSTNVTSNWNSRFQHSGVPAFRGFCNPASDIVDLYHTTKNAMGRYIKKSTLKKMFADLKGGKK